MLLTITTTHVPATDLGYLLAKNPAKLQTFSLSYGKAHVFYPVATPERCTAALLLEIDPVGLVRGRPRGDAGSSAQYVSDRPYVSSSFLSVAIAQVFGSALGGRSRERPELADCAIPLEVALTALPCRGGASFLRKLFEPLGYELQASRLALEPKFPAWGESPYFDVRFRARARLRDLLSHLYVLIPVLDDDKHYWVGDDEVEKLLAKGEGWLANHPAKDQIAHRYLKHRSHLARRALDQLMGEEGTDPAEQDEQSAVGEEAVERKLSLNEARLEAVACTLREARASTVIDLGCGEGKLLARLLRDPAFTRVAGVDVSPRVLELAEARLHTDPMGPQHRERLQLFQGALSYRDERFAGYDAAALVEVIEHVEPSRLGALERVVFEFARPGTVVVTTPNAEYNVRFENLPTGRFRHADHRFEWTRAQFLDWAGKVAARFGYGVRVLPIGEPDAELGAPTQMAVFSLREDQAAEREPAPNRPDEVLDIEDVSGKRILQTRCQHTVTVRQERAVPALEVMSRFAVDPRWLIYLPPTLSPCDTAQQGPHLEHASEALAYYRGQGLGRVICEEKRKGSRAVLVVCRDEEVAERRFHYPGGGQGACYTRTGRAFFAEPALERELLARVRAAIAKADLWNELETDWLCLDAEILPWSAKALEPLRRQYAGTAAAGLSSLSAALRILSETEGPEAAALRERFNIRRRAVEDYRDAYRRYCWPAKRLADYRIAPFHLLASEGKVHSDREHPWHLSMLARLAAADPDFFLATPHRIVELGNADDEAAAIAWWEELTAAGGEGMVVKPLDWLARGKKGPAQPALECRGREYLRIIYGPEYTLPEHLERLRSRGLSTKRALALREFALGLEALQRFVEREPLYRVHECVFGVLALESEPVDPRL